MSVCACGVPECAVATCISRGNSLAGEEERTEEPNGLLDRVVADPWREQVRVEKVLWRGAELGVVHEAALDDLGVPRELDRVPG